ncbi:hypothetical protein [Cellvibrio sp. pealriver]|uniref:hypothetical protein n=1 Tax=Cellvibrio sp. pealriver TaxID=1622269 RepID=UPI00066FEA0D|nr:hypothetical protein [Cellvibrio sp. pealriver]
MSNWYFKELGDGVAAFGPSTKIHEVFIQLAQSGMDMMEIAVFSHYDLKRNMVTLYFTPEAEILARSYGASTCEKPEPKEGFSLLVGEFGILKKHFPNYN